MKNRKLFVIAAFALLAVSAVILGCGTFATDGFLIPVEENQPKFLFVKNRNDSTVTAYTVNPSTGQLTLVQGSPFDIGDCCSAALAADPKSRFVYVPIFEDTLVVLGVNQASGAPSPVSGSPFDIGDCGLEFAAADPSGRFVYVTDDCNDVLFALTISPAGVPTVVDSPDVGPCPWGVTVDPDTKFVYVTDRCTDEIYGFAINPSTGTLTPVPNSPIVSGEGGGLRFPVVDRTGKFLYATHVNFDEVYGFSINPSTGELTSVGEFDTDCGPVGISASPKFDLVAVANWCGDSGTTVSVFSINPSSGTLTDVPGSPFDLASFTNDEGVHDLAFDPSGKFIYVTAPFAGPDGNGMVLGFTVDANFNPVQVPGSPFTEGLNEGMRLAISH